MKYNDSAKLDSSQVRKGGGSGGKIAIGGGAGLVLLVVILLLGGDPGQLLGGGPAEDSGSQTPGGYGHCEGDVDIDENRDCRWVAYTNSIQSYWSGALDGYQEIQVETFDQSTTTACGNATAAVGPFYCPADTTVYLDVGFFDQLTSQLGAEGGDAAEAYVIAHEFGHHVQKLTGTMDEVQSQGQTTGKNSPAVRLELQADCYAGAWMKNVTEDPDGPIAEITSDDLDRAVDAAEAVGDDRIQEKTQGQVSPESWTHGSAEMRKKWLLTGYESGDPNSCDTFTGNP